MTSCNKRKSKHRKLKENQNNKSKITHYYDFDEIDKLSEDILEVRNKFYRFSIYWYGDDYDKCYLSNVKVYKKYRNQGFGNKLLQEAFELAKRYEFNTIQLKLEDMSWQQKWYERNGFKFLNFSKFDSKVIYVWMTKDLT